MKKRNNYSRILGWRKPRKLSSHVGVSLLEMQYKGKLRSGDQEKEDILGNMGVNQRLESSPRPFPEPTLTAF